MEEGKTPKEGKAPEEKSAEQADEQAQVPPTPPTPPPAPPKKKAKWPIVLLVVLLICCVVSLVAGAAVVYIGKQAAQKGTEQLQESAKIEACKVNQRTLSAAIASFYANEERYPTSLDELKGEYLKGDYGGYEPYECPVNDLTYEYDSTTGKVTCPNGHTID